MDQLPAESYFCADRIVVLQEARVVAIVCHYTVAELDPISRRQTAGGASKSMG